MQAEYSASILRGNWAKKTVMISSRRKNVLNHAKQSSSTKLSTKFAT
jgi:hypothetical protein